MTNEKQDKQTILNSSAPPFIPNSTPHFRSLSNPLTPTSTPSTSPAAKHRNSADYSFSPLTTPLSPLTPKKLSLYKTELCRSYEETGYCRYGTKCQFAHSRNELRQIPRHPKYKTEICKTFWEQGTCPYGKRCCFIHMEKETGQHLRSASESDGSEMGGLGRVMSSTALSLGMLSLDEHADDRDSGLSIFKEIKK